MLNINWKEYHEDIQTLIEKIEESEIKFSSVFGIPRGGLIPTIIISHYFNIPYLEERDFFNVNLSSRNNCGLIVDDLSDTGTTFNKITKYGNRRIYTAALYVKNKSDFIPDFYVSNDISHDEWIMFPYDRDTSTEKELIEHHQKKVNDTAP